MKFYARKRRMPQVIIVSLIDIFAILLIFVIVTTTFKKPEKEQPAVTISLPESKTATAAAKGAEPVVLTISPDEEIFLDARQVSLEELKPEIEKLVRGNSKQTLALNADKKAPFGTVIKVIDVLHEAGVTGNLAAFMETVKQ